MDTEMFKNENKNQQPLIFADDQVYWLLSTTKMQTTMFRKLEKMSMKKADINQRVQGSENILTSLLRSNIINLATKMTVSRIVEPILTYESEW